MDSLTRSLRFLTIMRLVVVGTIVLSCLLIQASAGLNLRLGPIYGVGAAAVVLSGAWAAAGRVLRPVQQAYVHLCGDLVLVTALVYFSGASDSVFTFLYLVVIAVAAFLLLRRGALLVASLASILYGLMIELTTYEVIPPPPLRTTDRSIAFSSSRTFPGHWCWNSAFIASGSIDWTFLPFSAA